MFDLIQVSHRKDRIESTPEFHMEGLAGRLVDLQESGHPITSETQRQGITNCLITRIDQPSHCIVEF